ncbi:MULTISPECIES: muconolactone Delta-isomerase [Streptomyces]|uniref:muconolactone Delta-isomerase n=1 Tax=Streptomyces TaxID=1883 RepID=UPI0022585FB6|nr:MULTISPECIES: muconolactone Delta-isomerase [Streptomyces]MCX5446416.1 muconolactone Delta-isomerase [Streptomyces libani]WUB84339.1 muconolactone Delta-isomerase [Streptomyces platensis]
MLFHVRMDVRLPTDLDPTTRADIVAREKAYSQRLQREGKWPHLWRIVGEYSNFSVFDVESNDELHELLSALPLFPYMDIEVTALARHPSKASTCEATAKIFAGGAIGEARSGRR